MLVRKTIDLAEDEAKLVEEEAIRQHRTPKDQLEYIIEKWCEEKEKK